MTGREKEESGAASFELVLEHLGQLGALLKENPYSVFIFQGFLVGSWGELHDSAYLSEDCLKKMWERLRPGLGETIYGAVRTPASGACWFRRKSFRRETFHGWGFLTMEFSHRRAILGPSGP